MMIEQSRFAGSVVPFARRWHVIHELDLARLMAEHARLRSLCDQLEACADALPGRPSADQGAALRRQLRDLLEVHEQDQDCFLEQMFERELAQPLTATLLDHVRARHCADASHAHDLIGALDAARGPLDAVAAETLGYMLRCFFDGCRRAMDFELLVILALGQDRLTCDARSLLVSGLRQHARG